MMPEAYQNAYIKFQPISLVILVIIAVLASLFLIVLVSMKWIVPLFFLVITFLAYIFLNKKA